MIVISCDFGNARRFQSLARVLRILFFSVEIAVPVAVLVLLNNCTAIPVSN